MDLLGLSVSSDIELLASKLISTESLLTEKRRPQLRKLLYKLLERQETADRSEYFLFKVLRAHILPLTNCGFNKTGERFITGSYDRTCKVWDTESGEELRTLEGHRNVVYAIAFNNPYGDRIITGSFDKTCKVWDAGAPAAKEPSCSAQNTGCESQCLNTFRGHLGEIVCLCYDSKNNRVATGSMDNVSIVWDLEYNREVKRLQGHSAEIVSVCFDKTGDLVLTGSFDYTCRLWDVREPGTGQCAGANSQNSLGELNTLGATGNAKSVLPLKGHTGEISSVVFNFNERICASASIDKTCKIWDLRKTDTCVRTLRGHNDEILGNS